MNDRFEYGRIAQNAGLPRETVFSAVRLHRRALNGDPAGRVLKRAAKTNVTLVSAEDGPGREPVCVKEFVRPAALRLMPAAVRHRPAIRSWVAARELQARRVPSPEPLALVFGRGRSSYLLMRRALGEENARQVVARRFAGGRDAPARRAFVAACAEFLCDCWERGVFHQDLKAGNLHARESAPGRWEFELIDAAAVAFRERLLPQEMILNLMQLNSSTPRAITRTDRLRFMRDVFLRLPELAGRRTVHEVLRLSFGRGGVWLQ